MLELRDLHLAYARSGARVAALDGVDLQVAAGETVALVGESGSGKSTLARVVTALARPDRGRVLWHTADHGTLDVASLGARRLRPARRHVQMVFQDALDSLDPRQSIADSIAEPLRAFRIIRGRAARERAEAWMARVGLDPALAPRLPHQLSGGQRQRAGIARALAAEPGLLILDEAVSALDVTLRVQILRLLRELREQRPLALLFITHDMAVVRALAHRVAVMHRGRIVEVGSRETVLDHPREAYTRTLLGSVLPADPAIARTRLVGRTD